MGLENSPSSPRQPSSQGPHCPGKSCHCFLPAPPQSRDFPPNPADSTPGLELGSARWEARIREAKGTPPALRHHPDSGREAGELEGSGGANPHSFLSHKPPTPSSFLPCRQLGLGGSRGWSEGRKPAQGQQETQEAVGRVGSRGLGYCSIFSGKKTGGKTEDSVPSSLGPLGNPPQASVGSGGP